MSDDPMAPIKRLTSEDRVIAFESKSKNIYNKFSPYEGSGNGVKFGSQQPYVWTSINDSSTSKNLTKYDTQALPIGSTVRDLKRMGKFMASGTGLMFIGTQYLLQRQTAFNEVRVYNPASILTATAAKGSSGLIERPVRYLDGGFGGGILNFARNSLLSLVGMQATGAPVEGVASGNVSNYAAIGLSKGKGLVHLEAAKKASDRFSSKWVGSNSKSKTVGSGIGNFLKKLGTSLLNKFVPSTQPLGFGNTSVSNWVYRVEYPYDKDGVYHAFRDDSGGNFEFSVNGIKYTIPDINPYYAGASRQTTDNIPQAPKDNWYAAPNVPDDELLNRSVPMTDLYNNLADAVFEFNKDSIGNDIGNKRRYREQSNETIGKNYSDAVGSPGDKPTTFKNKLTDGLSLDRRGFSKSPIPNAGNPIGTSDSYNTLLPFKGERGDGRGDAPEELRMNGDYYNSKDIIYFYFYDLVNSTYIPFRATISGFNDLHTPEWEDVSYLGRADKLYIYKGFTREVNFAFTVYANSLKELVPMWKRINYLVGLSRPSKYTSGVGTTSQFMFPPMTTFRLGDVFVDQPCVLKSIGLTIPDDAVWETQRGDGKDYSFLEGLNIDFSSYSSDKLYQLPTKVDISIQMSIMEKERSEVGADHYFAADDLRRGGEANTPTATHLNDTGEDALSGAKPFDFTPPPDPSIAVPFTSTISSTTPTSLKDVASANARQFSTGNSSLTIQSPPNNLSFDSSFSSTPTSLMAFPPKG